MRLYTLPLGVLLFAAATPAFADDTAPPKAITVNGTATLISDYRFRGISQTDKEPAIQGSITVTHESGFYLSVWSSSTSGYVTQSGNGSQEIDLIAGFKKTSGGTTFDIGALYYVYPRSHIAGDHSSADFIEPYADISHTFGPVTAKVTVNYAPKQKALALDQGQSGLLKKNDNVYLAGDLSASIPGTPLAVSGHLGHTWGPSWLSIGKEYTDWNIGATYTWKILTVGVSYVDTDGTFITPSGKNASKGGVLGSIGVSF